MMLTAFTVAVLALTALAERLRLNAPLVLMLVGVLASFLPFIEAPELSPELVLVGLLPPLLYASAVTSSLIDFRRNIRAIGWLSVGLVLFTVAGIGVLIHALLPVSWPVAFAVGAIVAPPDAVAATAVAKSIGLPRRVVSVLEGESLVNDATALVSLRTAVVAISATVTTGQVVGDFAVAVVVAIAVGLIVGKLAVWALARLHDVLLATALTFVVPFVAYVPAEELHASGVLAVVVAGLAIGYWSSRLPHSGQIRINTRVNWAMIQFLLENAVFLLLGLQVHRIVSDAAANDLGWGRILLACVLTLVGVMVLRLVWVLATRVFVMAKKRQAANWGESVIIGWAGMRGVVTLAAALTLPSDLPNRSALILVAMAVTVGTLVVQGLTLPTLARRLGISGPDPREDALQEAVVMERVSRAGLEAAHAAAGDQDKDVMRRIEQMTSLRNNALWERLGRESEVETPSDAFRRLRLAALEGERADLLRIRDAGDVDAEVISSALWSLDAEEASLARIARRADLVSAAPLRPSLPEEPCAHLREAPCTVHPLTVDSCPECVAEGLTPVHLRLCLTCGHVGCCDSSVGRHATAHFEATGHPVMRSIEPGENWRWCFVDQLTGGGSE